MKPFRFVIFVWALVFGTALSVPAAASSSDPIIIVTSVDGTLTLTVALHKNDGSGPLVSVMDFGRLVDLGTGTLRSSASSTTGTGAIAAFVTVNSRGVPYTVTQTGTPMSSGLSTLPDGALTVKPVYAAEDNGGQALPPGASLGAPGTWVATNKVLYVSGPSGAIRTFQAYYSITDDPAAGATTGVPLTQPAGDYTGTVTLTATTT